MELFTDNTTRTLAGPHVKRLFSVDEADRSLVLVERIVRDIITEYARALDIQEAIEAAGSNYDRDDDDLHQQLLRAVGLLHDCMGELDCVGVELRDWAQGVIDFPSIANGREIFLCWKYGERRLSCWHEVDSDCSQRQSLTALGVAQVAAV